MMYDVHMYFICCFSRIKDIDPRRLTVSGRPQPVAPQMAAANRPAPPRQSYAQPGNPSGCQWLCPGVFHQKVVDILLIYIYLYIYIIRYSYVYCRYIYIAGIRYAIYICIACIIYYVCMCDVPNYVLNIQKGLLWARKNSLFLEIPPLNHTYSFGCFLFFRVHNNPSK